MRKSFSELLSEKRSDKGNQGNKGGLQEAMQRGVAASEAGDKQAAHAVFQRITVEYPNAVEAWVWLGWTSASIGDAEAAFTQAKQIDPRSQEAALGLRWVASQRENEPPPEAQPAQQHTPRIEPLSPRLPDTAEQYAQNHSLPDLAARKATGQDVDGGIQEGIEAVRAGNKAEAHKIFEKLAATQSSNADIWVWMGGTSSDMDEAEQAFRRAYDMDRNNEKAILGLRWVALRRQTLQPATTGPALSSDTSVSFESTESTEEVPARATVGPYTGPSAQHKEGVFSRFLKRLTGSKKSSTD